MENKLEQLLNSLIERGWCPFGKKDVYIETGEGYDFRDGFIVLKKEKGGTYTCESEYMPYRMLCTKGSGLWQFVCENGMVNVKDNRYDFFEYYKGMDEEGAFREAQRYDESYEYRLIESALKDEREIEDFLLSNIKIDGTTK